MARQKTDQELIQAMLKTIECTRELLELGNIEDALEGLGTAGESMSALKRLTKVDQALQDKLDSLSRDIAAALPRHAAAAQQRANDDGSGAASEEVDDEGSVGPAAPAQQAAQYGACQQNGTSKQQGYVALAGSDDGGAKDTPCDKCMIL